MPQPKTDQAGQTIIPVMITHMGDGSTPLTNRDVSNDINFLKILLGYAWAPTNFTTTPLAAGATYTGNAADMSYGGLHNILGFMSAIALADQDGMMYIEQSINGANWDYSESQAVTANVGAKLKSALCARYARAKYVNGGVAQTVFRFGGRFSLA